LARRVLSLADADGAKELPQLARQALALKAAELPTFHGAISERWGK
jgi:hypothetical protein